MYLMETPVTGSGYAKGDSLVITDPAESTNIITIASLNYVQTHCT